MSLSILLVLIVFVILGGIVTNFVVKDVKNLEFEKLNCRKYEVKTAMDSPMDNLIDLLGGKLAITAQRGPDFVLTLYTVFAIPVGNISYSCSEI